MQLSEKLLPVNLDAEKFVIGSVLLRGSDCFHGLAITAADFALEKHRRLWVRISSIVERGDSVDYVTLANELVRFSELESVDGISYIASLTEGLPQLDNLDSYVKILREKAGLRKLANVCQSGLHRAMNAEEDCSSIVSGQISALQSIETSGDASWSTPSEVIGTFSSRQNFLSPAANGARIGVPFPWEGVQSLTCGMQRGELIIVAGRPSMGKSAIALQMAVNASSMNYPVGYVSLEMKDPALIRRAVVQIAQVDSMKMRLGYLSSHERGRIVEACNAVEGLPIYVDDKQASGRNAQAIVASIRQLQSRSGIQVAFVDHMHLIDGPEREERTKFNRIIDCLQRGARDLGIPLVVLAQLSRKCEEERREPGLSDLRETGKIEDNADLVMFIHRPEMYSFNRERDDLKGIAKLIIAKQRDGAVGSCNMIYLKEQTRFVEMAGGSEEVQ